MQNNQKKTKLSLAGRLRILISAFLVFLFSGVIAANFISVGYSALSTTLFNNALGASSPDDDVGKWIKKNEFSISGSVDGTDGTCSSSNSSTLTLTNRLSVPASLSFDYSITENNGSVTIDGKAVNTDGKFVTTQELAAQSGSVKITITSGEGTNKVTSIEINNIQLVNKNAVSITFLTPTNGSYTVDGEEISESVTKNSVGNTQYTLEATPNSGYKFIQWEKVVNGNTSILSKEQNSSITISESCSIRPVFVFENAAQFMNNGSYFYDLQDAINSANSSSDKTIVVTGNGSVSAGTYTIASDCTLLVPFDEAGTVHAELSKDEFTTATPANKCYRKLVLDSNVILNVHGVLAVESQLCSLIGYCGSPVGNYGQLQLESNSTVNMFSGSTLYAWGYITGDGVVNAKSGATVFEAFQILNFRGGRATLTMINNSQKVFPFNQYSVQNVECKLVLEYGAVEKCTTGLYVSSQTFVSTVLFVGTSGTLFSLASGSLSKQLVDNRLVVEINGDASLNSISVSFKFGITSYTIDSSKYVLPINHSMDITITSGTVTTNQDLAFLPFTSVTICNGATFSISKRNSVYVYDSDQWSADYDYSAIKFPYCATTQKKPTDSTNYDKSDAVFDVNGTLKVCDGGYLCTTESGACIKSSNKTGVVEWQCTTAIPKGITHQCTQSGTSISYSDIPTTSAKLQNLDGSYYQTAGKTSCSIIYSTDRWKDSSITTDTITLKFIDQNGNELMTSSFENPGSFTFPTKDSSWSINVYFWQYSDGTLYSPGKTSSLNLRPDNENYIFTARSSGWVTETSTNKSYYLSDDFGSDKIYPGCVKGLYSVIYKDSKQQKICYFNENGVFQDSYYGVFHYTSNTYSFGDDCYYYLLRGVVVEKAGLQRIEVEQTVKYYYFGEDNRAYRNGTYYISTTLNKFLCPGTYTFNDDGSIVTELNVNTDKNVVIPDDGTYCHIDGIKVGYGLFPYNGHYYYAQSDGTLVKDKTVYVSKNYSSISITGFTFPGLYYFDSNGYLCDSSLTPVEAS
ncbi:MAG: hypothetical protein PUI56_01700 [bacterium]|nr:hypothetical protein [bacterium]MDY5257363.1 hypothetical protein [Candidatus Enterosoma sp.]